MEFRGKFSRESHEGGLLVAFTGAAPHLGTALETAEGTYLGRVDSVIGKVDCALVHILPLAKGLEVSSISDSDITIQQRKQREERHRNDRRGRDQNHRGRGGNRFGGRNERRGDRRERRDSSNFGGQKGGNDWECPKCQNNNFAWRDTCNRCPAKRPSNSGGGYRGESRGARGGNRGGYQGGNRGERRGGNRGERRGGNRGERRGGRRGDRRGGQGDKRDNNRGRARHWGNRDGDSKKSGGYHRKKKSPNNPFKKKRND